MLDYSLVNCKERLARLAEAAELHKEGDSDEVLAQKFIDRIRELNASFDIPEKLVALQEADIASIATAALKEAHSTYAVPRYMRRSDCEALVRRMLG